LRQNLQQVAPNQEKPHTTPLHSLIYSIYISVHSFYAVVPPPRVHPHTRKRVLLLPLGPGGDTLARGEGDGGTQFRRWDRHFGILGTLKVYNPSTTYTCTVMFSRKHENISAKIPNMYRFKNTLVFFKIYIQLSLKV
jgi:hypothetical protein